VIADPAGLRRRPGGDERWLSRAFGLDLDLGFPAPGLPRVDGASEQIDPTRVDLVYADSIDAAWPRDETRRVGTMGPPERPVMEVDEHLTAGYRIALRPLGRYLVSADGRAVSCAPPAVGWWYWQRLLIGQVLPAAAALRGFELMHASAATVGDRAVAFAGLPGLGKSSLALRLMLRRCALMAEDVLALSVVDGQVIAEPGAAMLNVHEDEYAALDRGERELLGDTVGDSDGKVHVVGKREHRSLPLGALYLLDRGDASQPSFEPIVGLRAADIFSNSFVLYVHRAERMIRQLDIASALARTVPVFRLLVQPDVDAAELAGRVEEHAGSLA
jgi:hypothetical protein